MQPHGFAAVAALGATLTGRPVRVRLTRTQDMTMTGKRQASTPQWRVGFDARRSPPGPGRHPHLGRWLEPRPLARRSSPVPSATCDNAYHLPHVSIRGRVARTNKTSQTAFRGFGGPQGMLVIEDILGRCAPLLGLDPAELRRRNLYTAGQTHPLRPGGPPRRAARAGLGRRSSRRPTSTRAAPRSPPSTRATRTPSAARRHARSSSASRSTSRRSTRRAPSCTSTRTARSWSTTAARRWARGCTPR